MITKSKLINEKLPDSTGFWEKPSIKKWLGLVLSNPESLESRRKAEFLDEWRDTLQILRDIGRQASERYRPDFVGDLSPSGTQSDQFLHAYYCKKVRSGKRSIHEEFHEKNKGRKEQPLSEALDWWHKLSKDECAAEIQMLNVEAPFLKDNLSSDSLKIWT